MVLAISHHLISVHYLLKRGAMSEEDWSRLQEQMLEAYEGVQDPCGIWKEVLTRWDVFPDGYEHTNG